MTPEEAAWQEAASKAEAAAKRTAKALEQSRAATEAAEAAGVAATAAHRFWANADAQQRKAEIKALALRTQPWERVVEPVILTETEWLTRYRAANPLTREQVLANKRLAWAEESWRTARQAITLVEQTLRIGITEPGAAEEVLLRLYRTGILKRAQRRANARAMARDPSTRTKP